MPPQTRLVLLNPAARRRARRATGCGRRSAWRSAPTVRREPADAQAAVVVPHARAAAVAHVHARLRERRRRRRRAGRVAPARGRLADRGRERARPAGRRPARPAAGAACARGGEGGGGGKGAAGGACGPRARRRAGRSRVRARAAAACTRPRGARHAGPRVPRPRAARVARGRVDRAAPAVHRRAGAHAADGGGRRRRALPPRVGVARRDRRVRGRRDAVVAVRPRALARALAHGEPPAGPRVTRRPRRRRRRAPAAAPAPALLVDRRARQPGGRRAARGGRGRGGVGRDARACAMKSRSARTACSPVRCARALLISTDVEPAGFCACRERATARAYVARSRDASFVGGGPKSVIERGRLAVTPAFPLF